MRFVHVLIIACALPHLSSATKVHFQDVSLEEVIASSQVVAVAKPVAPAQTRDSVSVLPDGSEYEGKNQPPYFSPPYNDTLDAPSLSRNYPPFRWTWTHVVVTEVLRQEGTAVSVGDTLAIASGDLDRKLDMHRGYHLYGHRKSPIVQRYAPSKGNGVDSDDEDGFIVFLHHKTDVDELTRRAGGGEGTRRWEFTVRGARESLRKRKQILRWKPEE